MKVSQTAVRIDGRLLRSPTLEYAANQSAKIKNGAWNLIQTKFKIPATVRVWMVADFTRNTSKRDQFARTLRESFALLGGHYSLSHIQHLTDSLLLGMKSQENNLTLSRSPIHLYT